MEDLEKSIVVIEQEIKNLKMAVKSAKDVAAAQRRKLGIVKSALEENLEDLDKPKKNKLNARISNNLPESLSSGKITIGGVIEDALLRGLATEDVLNLVQEKFPHAKTSKPSVYNYKTKLYREGRLSRPIGE